jgi:DNA-binding response OmpR family regulator
MFQLPDNVDAEGKRIRRILVVDDESTLRLGFAYALSNSATSVATASSGREALLKIENAYFDIIILDLRMPDLDGIGVIDELRKRNVDVPIILCSGLPNPHASLHVIRQNVVDFLIKPMSPNDLRGIVDFVLNPSEHPLSSALQAIRNRQPLEAIRLLEQLASSDIKARHWLRVLKAIRETAQDDDPAGLEQKVSSSFVSLAFNSPGSDTRT